MKNRLIFIFSLLLSFASVGQTSNQIQATMDSLIPDSNLKVVTPARLRFGFSRVINFVSNPTFSNQSITLPKIDTLGSTEGQIPKIVGGILTWSNDISGGLPIWGNVTGTLSSQTDLAAALAAKVDKLTGKGLSTEDYTATEKGKLAGIATGATANQTDAYLLNRVNHTGTSAISSISGLQTALDGKEPVIGLGSISINKLTISGGTDSQVLKISGGVLGFSTDATGTATGLTTVANITALRAKVGASGEMVQTLGYYTANDGGGWAYIWNASSTATDNGVNIIDANGATAGAWEFVYLGFIHAKMCGAKSDGIQDNYSYLQAAIDYIVQKGGTLYLSSGIYNTTQSLRAGTISPANLPASENATIKGDGPAFNWTATDPQFTNGTNILLKGTGKTAIIDIKAGLGRYFRMQDLTFSCETSGGATYGVLWSQTTHSEHIMERVHSRRAGKAWAILKGGFANGEFITMNKCNGDGVTGYWFEDTDTGQSFNHLLNHCAGSVNDGGTLFEFGGAGLGFGFSAIEFNSSNPINFSTSMGVTFLKNNGISGIVNFIGGRLEGVSTVLWNVQGSQNQAGKINLSGMHFDGMGSTATRQFMKSTSANSRQSINLTNCIFTPIDAAAEINITTGDTDNSAYIFSKCEFSNYTTWKIAITETVKGKLVFDDCTRKNLSTSDVLRFSKNYSFNSPNPLANIYKPQNLLLQSGFSSSTGESIAATSWTHTGTSSFYALYNNTNHLGGYSNDTKFRQAVLNVNSSVYQNVAAFTFGTGENVAYYRLLASYHAANGMRFKVTLSNSSTGKIYDEITFKGTNNAGAVIPIDLIANDGNVGGNVRVTLTNLDTGNPFYLNVLNQYLCTNPMGGYVETTTAIQDLPYIVR